MKCRAAVLTLLLILPACGVSQDKGLTLRPMGGFVSFTIHEDWYGTVSCGTRPIYWLSGETPKGDEEWVRVHEETHIRQVKAFPNCAAFHERFRGDYLFRLQTEAEAYCAGARWELYAGRFKDIGEAAWKHAQGMASYFGIHPAEAVAYIMVYCGESGTGSGG